MCDFGEVVEFLGVMVFCNMGLIEYFFYWFVMRIKWDEKGKVFLSLVLFREREGEVEEVILGRSINGGRGVGGGERK